MDHFDSFLGLFRPFQGQFGPFQTILYQCGPFSDFLFGPFSYDLGHLGSSFRRSLPAYKFCRGPSNTKSPRQNPLWVLPKAKDRRKNFQPRAEKALLRVFLRTDFFLHQFFCYHGLKTRKMSGFRKKIDVFFPSIFRVLEPPQY